MLAVTENQRIVRYAEGKPTLCEQVVRTGHEAVIIYVAARISKVRELRFEKLQTLRQATRGCRLDKSDTGTVLRQRLQSGEVASRIADRLGVPAHVRDSEGVRVDGLLGHLLG